MVLTVSVALCTFDSARFIEKQLRSILEQELLPDEIVISDDGSRDDTLAIVTAVLSEQSAVAWRVLTGPAGLGVTANFDRATAACVGDLVALCDHDDVWHPDRLSAVVPRFLDDPTLLLVHADARLVDAGGAPTGRTLFGSLGVSEAELAEIRGGGAFGAYLRRNLVTGAVTVFRRAVLTTASPFPSSWVHDEWIAVVAAAIGAVAVDTRQLIDYRQHGANAIGVQDRTLRYRIGRMLEPRGARYEGLRERTAALAARLESAGADGDTRLRVGRKLAFESMRAGLPGARLRRLKPILRAWRRGDYADLSSQRSLDVLRDLLQPA